MVEQTVTLSNQSGLHARPAAIFAQTANRFRDTTIQVIAGGRAVDAKSILSLLSLGASAGSGVTIRAEGPSEAEAVAALVKLIESGFAE